MINLENVEELFRSRYSCRTFDPSAKVEPELIQRIAEAAMLAPSACNSQPWHVYAVTASDKVKELADAVHKLGMNKFAENCTAFFVIAAGKANLTSRIGAKITDLDFVSNDVGIMTAHLVLAAAAAGVNTCILGMFDEEKARSAVGAKPEESVRLIVAAGKAATAEVSQKKRADGKVTLIKD